MFQQEQEREGNVQRREEGEDFALDLVEGVSGATFQWKSVRNWERMEMGRKRGTCRAMWV